MIHSKQEMRKHVDADILFDKQSREQRDKK
jgi:hypothetical protein